MTAVPPSPDGVDLSDITSIFPMAPPAAGTRKRPARPVSTHPVVDDDLPRHPVQQPGLARPTGRVALVAVALAAVAAATQSLHGHVAATAVILAAFLAGSAVLALGAHGRAMATVAVAVAAAAAFAPAPWLQATPVALMALTAFAAWKAGNPR